MSIEQMLNLTRTNRGAKGNVPLIYRTRYRIRINIEIRTMKDVIKKKTWRALKKAMRRDRKISYSSTLDGDSSNCTFHNAHLKFYHALFQQIYKVIYSLICHSWPKQHSIILTHLFVKESRFSIPHTIRWASSFLLNFVIYWHPNYSSADWISPPMWRDQKKVVWVKYL